MIWPGASLDCHIWDTWSSVTGPSLINARLKKMTEFLGPIRGATLIFSVWEGGFREEPFCVMARLTRD